MNQERDIQSSPGILSLQGEEHVKTPGQIAYAAYHQGSPLPWALLPACQRENWEAAAQAVLALQLPAQTMTPGHFVCLRCYALSEDPAVSRHPVSALAGYEAETGAPLCDGCVNAAREEEASLGT